MDLIIYAGKISGCIKREYIREFGNKKFRIWTAEEFLADLRKEFEEEEEAVKVTELKRLEQRKNNREVCTKIQKSSKGK